MNRLAFAAAAAALLIGAPPAWPQAPAPPAAASVDPAQQRAQSAFEALPEAERRQIQLDLNFAAEFSGAALGTFGPLTYRALQAFERNNKSGVDGILDPRERAALALTAKRERDRLGFRQVSDPSSKTSIGLPTALLPKTEPQPGGGTRWQTADGKVSIATRAPAAAEGTLEQLYEKAQVSGNPQRKVTYKLLRPDFYVIAGETPQGKFYQRMAKLPDGSLRGFSIAYDKALAPVWDKLTVAAANTFAPAGQGAAEAAAQGAAGAAAPRPALAPPPDPLAPRRFERSLTAVVVAPGRAVTASAALKACQTPRIGNQAVKLLAEDAQTGLSLVSADGLSAPPIGVGAAAPAVAEHVGVLAPGLLADGQRGLLALPGEISGTSLSAALQPGAAGAPVFGPRGLAGVVVSDPSARLQVAGVVLSARHRIADATAVERFLKANGVALPPVEHKSAVLGGVAARYGRSIVAVACGQ
jgi:peptidoglycan hydrolase-like protein with peptidoglycan-binding domain